MEGFKICFSNILVTPTALIDDFEFKAYLISPADRVRLVTPITCRQRLVGLVHRRRMNALDKLFINTMVALGTRLGDIIRVYT